MAEPAAATDHEAPAGSPALLMEPDPAGESWCVRAVGLGPHIDAAVLERTPRPLRIRVADAEELGIDDLPDVSGSLLYLDDELRFVPDFPFRAEVLYRAILSLPGSIDVQTREFSLPGDGITEDTGVAQVYPSADVLPENLLRFYVQFSGPMRRGFAEQHIAILGQDGTPVPDVLYRAPAELWDRSMTCLTVLLDPGRLKRGVGPNRALGSPLEAGRRYSLRIGAGMMDARGRPLRDGFSKSFSVAEPVRAALGIKAWRLRSPAAGSREPLELAFPAPLDWAQLRHGLAVTSQAGQTLRGSVALDRAETLWRFIPDDPWRVDTYQVCVSPTLEDICGNTVSGAFDGPLRSELEIARETSVPSIAFEVHPA